MKYLLISFNILLFSILIPSNLIAEKIPNLSIPTNSNQKRLYHQMKMKRYNDVYQKNLKTKAVTKIVSDTKIEKKIRLQNRKSVNKKTSKNKNLPYHIEYLDNTKPPTSKITKRTTNKKKKRRLVKKKKHIKNKKRNLRKKKIVRKSKIKRKKKKRVVATPNLQAPKKEGWESLFRNTSAVPGFNVNLAPQKKGPFRYFSPKFYKGIYLNNAIPRRTKKAKKILRNARKHQINVLVVDVQPRIPSAKFIKMARENDFYLVARIVVFPGGLKKYPPSSKKIKKLASLAKKAVEAGFMEIQLDYIRFSDYYKGRTVSKRQRYRTVATIIKTITDVIHPMGVKVGADIFGRIPFNRDDRIGQKLEVFALHLDTIYPMLYPSHFYGDPKMQNNPYNPVYLGTKKSIKRIGSSTKIIAYIQAFRIHVKKTKLSYLNYIYKQLKGVGDAEGAGFIAWNAGNRYSTFYKALDKFNKLQKKNQAPLSIHP